jgi:hypothetical protein
MALAVKLSEVCDDLITMLAAQAEKYGIPDEGIFYGDQERIPVSPCICVEPYTKAATLYGAGRMTEVILQVYVLVYHSEIRDLESNRRDADRLAEDLSDLLNYDATFGGRAIHCFVSEVQSGYSQKQNTTVRSSKITFEVRSQERLNNNP